jgi:hypothetical protein
MQRNLVLKQVVATLPIMFKRFETDGLGSDSLDVLEI